LKPHQMCDETAILPVSLKRSDSSPKRRRPSASKPGLSICNFAPTHGAAPFAMSFVSNRYQSFASVNSGMWTMISVPSE
jgi:hypothetical protein